VKCSIVRLMLQRMDSPSRPINGSPSSPRPSWRSSWVLRRPRFSARSRRVSWEGSGTDRSGCLSLILGSFSFRFRAIVDASVVIRIVIFVSLHISINLTGGSKHNAASPSHNTLVEVEASGDGDRYKNKVAIRSHCTRAAPRKKNPSGDLSPDC
jgi:hypothetical protein